MADRDRQLVWSTSEGDLRKARDRSGGAKVSADRRGAVSGRADRRGAVSGGGRVKVRRETAGRRGKVVTTVSEVPVDDAGLRELAGRLKKRCGVGGSAKNGVIELQGDHRGVVVQVLRDDGYDVVLAGG